MQNFQAFTSKFREWLNNTQNIQLRHVTLIFRKLVFLELITQPVLSADFHECCACVSVHQTWLRKLMVAV